MIIIMYVIRNNKEILLYSYLGIFLVIIGLYFCIIILH